MARQKKVKVAWVGIPSNTADKKELQNSIVEASNSKLRIEAENDHITSIFETMNEKFGITRRKFNKYVKIYHKQCYASEVTDLEEMKEEYTDLMQGVDTQTVEVW